MAKKTVADLTEKTGVNADSDIIHVRDTKDKKMQFSEFKKNVGYRAFKTFADLLNEPISRFNDGDKVVVHGAKKLNDGGGGILHLDMNENRSNHDGGAVINYDHNSTVGTSGWYSSTGDSTDDTGTGCWKRDFSDVVYMEWFAIETGNLIHEALQSALDNHLYVKFKTKGTFIHDQLVTISNEDTILDIGKATIKAANDSNKVFFELTADRTGIINGTIDGNYAQQRGFKTEGVKISNSKNNFCRKVKFIEIGGVPIKGLPAEATTVEECEIIDCHSSAMIFNLDDANPIEGPKIRKCKVDVRNLGTNAIDGGIKVVLSSQTTGDAFTSWEISDCEFYADPAAPTYECYVAAGNNGTFSNNYAYGYAIGCTFRGKNNSIYGNVFEENSDYGLEFGGLKYSTISDNKTHKCGFGLLLTGNTTDKKNEDLSFVSNRFLDSVNRHFSLNYSDGIRFIDNTFRGGVECLLSDNEGKTLFAENTFDDNGVTLNYFMTLQDYDNVRFSGNNFIGTADTRIARFNSSDSGFIPDNVAFERNKIEASQNVQDLVFDQASGQVGDNFEIKRNTAPEGKILARNFDSYKDDISKTAYSGSPVGNLDHGVGSEVVDKNNGERWIKTESGNEGWRRILGTYRGNTANRPSNPKLGQDYFDTELGKPIWWNGSNWVDSTGTSV